jgi:hypothetical protein
VIRVPLCAVVALFATLVPFSAGAAVKSDERVLVVLATAGAEPYSVGDVERTAAQATAFLKTSSFGQVHLRVDVTPWLPAFTATPGCGGSTSGSIGTVAAPARAAADRAGFDASHYDDVVYAIADSHCGYFGATVGKEVLLTRQPTLDLLLHELGHAFGLGHAQSSPCVLDSLRCATDDTGDPFSPMGHGSLDYSAYEKSLLGWLPAQPRVSKAGGYLLAPPTTRTQLAQTLVVETEGGTWWIEYRAKPFRGLVFRFVDPTQHPYPFAPSAVLIEDPAKKHRAWIGRGESYRLPLSFRVTLARAGAARAEVRFR